MVDCLAFLGGLSMGPQTMPLGCFGCDARTIDGLTGERWTIRPYKGGLSAG
jgi:hypothetical protein